MALFDAFLKIDGIKGESADAKHKAEIDVLSFQWGVFQTGTSGMGGGGGAGKAQFEDFTFVKKVDASSPLLMLNCAGGTHIKEVNFVVRKAGGEQLEYLKIKLSDVLVSCVEPGAGEEAREAANSPADASVSAASASASSLSSMLASNIRPAGLIGLLSPPLLNAREAASNPAVSAVGLSDVVPTEEISLNFSKIEIAYQPQGADGRAQGGPIVAGYDIKASQKV